MAAGSSLKTSILLSASERRAERTNDFLGIADQIDRVRSWLGSIKILNRIPSLKIEPLIGILRTNNSVD